MTAYECLEKMKNDGLPLLVITEIVKVRRGEVQKWLKGENIPEKTAERIIALSELLFENAQASLATLYDYWHHELNIDTSLAELLMADTMNCRAIRYALRQLWPLAKQQKMQSMNDRHWAYLTAHPFAQQAHQAAACL